MNKCTATAILRRDKLNNKTGLAPVALQVFINGQRRVVSLNVYIMPENWDSGKRKVTGGSEMKGYNLVIEQALAKANKIFVDYHLMEMELTPDVFINEYSGKDNRNDFVQFYERELTRRYNLEVISSGTYRGQKSTLSKLKLFKPSIMFSELTPDLIERFDSWHRKYLQKSCEKRGRTPVMESRNTREKAKSHIRTYINVAIKRKGVKIKTPFEVVKVKQIQTTRTFLERNELQMLADLFETGEITQTARITLARFLFACFASIRISDSQRLHEIKLVNDAIEFIPEKVRFKGKRQTIPLNKSARKYYDYLSSQDFETVSKEEMNRTLKRLSAITGINKNITFHVARHTFATQFIANGGDVTVLQSILGHEDIRATMVYVSMAKNVQRDQIMKLDSIVNTI